MLACPATTATQRFTHSSSAPPRRTSSATPIPPSASNASMNSEISEPDASGTPAVSAETPGMSASGISVNGVECSGANAEGMVRKRGRPKLSLAEKMKKKERPVEDKSLLMKVSNFFKFSFVVITSRSDINMNFFIDIL